jgi:hypothetical protein
MFKLVDLILMECFFLMQLFLQHVNVLFMVVLLFLEFLFIVLNHVIISLLGSIFLFIDSSLKSFLLNLIEVLELTKLLL